MDNVIEMNAEKVWETVERKGSLSIVELRETMPIDMVSLLIVLGWLAKEGKVKIDPNGIISAQQTLCGKNVLQMEGLVLLLSKTGCFIRQFERDRQQVLSDFCQFKSK